MNQVKIVTDFVEYKLEEEINQWLAQTRVDVKDIQFRVDGNGNVCHWYTAMIIYEAFGRAGKRQPKRDYD